MGWGEIFAGGAAAGGRLGGIGLMLWTVFQAFKFSCTFLAGRQDARHRRLDEREERLAASLGKRLEHLERAQLASGRIERANQERIRVLENVVSILTAELRSENPNNPKLKQVGQMMANVTPIVVPDPALDELMEHARRGLDGETS